MRLTELGLAKLVGVTRGAVQQWEREGGTAPKRMIRPKVAEALGITVYDLAAAESQTPVLGVAQGVSPLNFTMPPLLQWEDVMKRKLPETFRCAMPDDALRDTTPQGTVLLCSTKALPEFGKGVIVKDGAGIMYVRRYSQGRAGDWIAVADGPGFASLRADDGVKIVAVVVGRLDGSV